MRNGTGCFSSCHLLQSDAFLSQTFGYMHLGELCQIFECSKAPPIQRLLNLFRWGKDLKVERL